MDFPQKKSKNYITASVIEEVKDFKSKLFLESTIEEGLITIMEPDPLDIKNVTDVIRKSGDVLRLSDEDRNLVALSFKLKREEKDPMVVTDDYSMQNVLKIVGIPFRSVLTEGITEIYGWVKICKGCKKKYPHEYAFDECEICGTRIIKKRIKKKTATKQ